MTAPGLGVVEPDKKVLRDFALTTGTIVAGLFGVFFPWLLEIDWPRWPWILSALLIVTGVVAPSSLRLVYKAWMRFGMLLNKITSPLIMGLVFFVVITPLGYARRVLSRDPMSRELSDADSYRIESKKSPAKNMERPF